ncbi:hypothetical protein LY76DRAFT_670916 [Colletotrichum caudatum]|nr:hypothetical protein LY76DRAFT_670916 [Colletotrichum caudatum]
MKSLGPEEKKDVQAALKSGGQSIDTAAQRVDRYYQYLDSAWGSRRSWLPEEYFSREVPGVNVAGYMRRITTAAINHRVHLPTLWAPGGVLHQVVHSQDMPGLSAKHLAVATSKYEKSFLPVNGEDSEADVNTPEKGRDHSAQPEASFATRADSPRVDRVSDFNLSPEAPSRSPSVLSSHGRVPDEAFPNLPSDADDDSQVHDIDHISFGNFGDEVDQDDPVGTTTPLLSLQCLPSPTSISSPPLPEGNVETSSAVKRTSPSLDHQPQSPRLDILNPDDTRNGPRHHPDASIAMQTALAQLGSPGTCLEGDAIWALIRMLAPDKDTLKRRGIKIVDPLYFKVDAAAPDPGQRNLFAISRLGNIRHVYIPIHHIAGGGHWTFAHMEFAKPDENSAASVRHFDSLPSPDRSKAVRKEFEMLVSKSIPGCRLLFEEMTCPRQNDHFNCGIFVVAFFQHVINGTPIPQSIEPSRERLRLLRLLTPAAETLPRSGLATIAEETTPATGEYPIADDLLPDSQSPVPLNSRKDSQPSTLGLPVDTLRERASSSRSPIGKRKLPTSVHDSTSLKRQLTDFITSHQRQLNDTKMIETIRRAAAERLGAEALGEEVETAVYSILGHAQHAMTKAGWAGGLLSEAETLHKAAETAWNQAEEAASMAEARAQDAARRLETLRAFTHQQKLLRELTLASEVLDLAPAFIPSSQVQALVMKEMD